jgi:hypothetical protein
MGETKEYEREVLDLLREISSNTAAESASAATTAINTSAMASRLDQVSATLSEILTVLQTPPADTDVSSFNITAGTPTKQ